MAVFIANDDQRREAHVAAALYRFGYAVYGYKLFF